MRIISFSKKWQKLSNLEFTTFRFPRADKDWYVGEMVQVYFKNRSPQREKLGEAQIIGKEKRELDSWFVEQEVAPLVSEQEAMADGFSSVEDMTQYMEKQYGLDYISLFNKLTLRWVAQQGV